MLNTYLLLSGRDIAYHLRRDDENSLLQYDPYRHKQTYGTPRVQIPSLMLGVDSFGIKHSTRDG